MGIKNIQAKLINSKAASAPEAGKSTALLRRNVTPRTGEVVRVDSPIRGDSWDNIVSGLGIFGVDKRLTAEPSLNVIDWITAEVMWRADDMAARIIELIPYEETREGFELCADDADKLKPEMVGLDPEGGPEGAPGEGEAPKPGEEGRYAKPPAEPGADPATDPPPDDPAAQAKDPTVKPGDPSAPKPEGDPAVAAPKAGEPVKNPDDRTAANPHAPDQMHKPLGAGGDNPAGKPAEMPNGLQPDPMMSGAPRQPDPNAPENKGPGGALEIKGKEAAGSEKPGETPNPEAKPGEGAPPPKDPDAQPVRPGEETPAAGGGLQPAKPPPFVKQGQPPGAPGAPQPEGPDPLEEIEHALDEMELLSKIYEARTYARAYGGGAWLLGADDGQRDMSKPLDPKRVRAFEWINVLHPRELSPATWYGDPGAPKYGEIETYYLTPDNMDGLGRLVGTQIVHESRIVRFDGVVVSKRHRRESVNGWGDSTLTRCWEIVRDFQSSWAATGVLMQDFSQTIFKMKGLADLVASEDPEDAQRFRNRVRAADYSRSVLNSVMLDADGEDFERKTTTVTGLPDLLDRFATRLAAAARIPVSKLMGESPAGLNATGDANIRWFYDDVKAGQVRDLSKIVRKVCELKAQAMGLKLPEKWSIKWKPLWQLDELQEAQRRKAVVEMVALAITNQMITPEEGAVSLWGGDTFSAEIKLATSDRSAMAAERKAADDEAAQMNLEAAKAGGAPGGGGFPPKSGGKPGGFGGKPVAKGKPPSGGGGFGKKPGGFGK